MWLYEVLNDILGVRWSILGHSRFRVATSASFQAVKNRKALWRQLQNVPTPNVFEPTRARKQILEKTWRGVLLPHNLYQTWPSPSPLYQLEVSLLKASQYSSHLKSMGCQFGMSVSPTMCSVCTFVMLPAGCFATCASQTRVKAFSFSTFGTNQKLPSCKSDFATICNNLVVKNKQNKTCARKFFAEPAFFNLSHLNLASSKSGVVDVNRES